MSIGQNARGLPARSPPAPCASGDQLPSYLARPPEPSYLARPPENRPHYEHQEHQLQRTCKASEKPTSIMSNRSMSCSVPGRPPETRPHHAHQEHQPERPGHPSRNPAASGASGASAARYLARFPESKPHHERQPERPGIAREKPTGIMSISQNALGISEKPTSIMSISCNVPGKASASGQHQQHPLAISSMLMHSGRPKAQQSPIELTVILS